MRFQLHEVQKDGSIWHSDEMNADAGEREVIQRVIAGYSGKPRWATATDQPEWFCGVNAKGQLVSTPF